MSKEFMDYSSILGITDKYSDEELDRIIAEYKSEQKKQLALHTEAARTHDFFSRNVNGLERMKAGRRRIRIAKAFVLHRDHISLLSKMHFQVNDNNVLIGRLPDEKEIATALNIKAFDQNGDYFKEDSEMVDSIIEELQYAIKEIINERWTKFHENARAAAEKQEQQ